MRKIRETIQQEKENMPTYQFNFLYNTLPRIMSFVFFILIVGVISTAILSEYLENELLYALPLICAVLLSIPFFIHLIKTGRKVRGRLVEEKTHDFEQKYPLLPFEVAKEILEQEGIIKDHLAIIYENSYRIKELYTVFIGYTISGLYTFGFGFNHKDFEEPWYLELDSPTLSYYYHRLELVSNGEILKLFVEDKKLYVKLLLKYNGDIKKTINAINRLKKL